MVSCRCTHLARAPCTRALHASRPHLTHGRRVHPILPPRYLQYPRRLTRKGGPPALGWRLANHQGAGSSLEPTRAASIALRRTLATLTWQAQAQWSSALGRAAGRAGTELRPRMGGAGSGARARMALPRGCSRGGWGGARARERASVVGMGHGRAVGRGSLSVE